MTHEEIEAAIGRLERHSKEDHSAYAVLLRFMGGNEWLTQDLRYALISLLRQADPYTHLKLPKGADGVPINVGDEVDGDHREDGTVVGIQYCEDTRVLIAVRPRNWDTATWYYPAEYRQHKPTVEDVLREFVNEWVEADSEGDIFAEYAAKLRDVMANDDD